MQNYITLLVSSLVSWSILANVLSKADNREVLEFLYDRETVQHPNGEIHLQISSPTITAQWTLGYLFPPKFDFLLPQFTASFILFDSIYYFYYICLLLESTAKIENFICNFSKITKSSTILNILKCFSIF